MAHLPGWDRTRLALAEAADVAAARWIVFAREMRPIVTADYAGQREALARADITDAKSLERVARQARARARAALIDAERNQAEIRKVLGLDDEDEPVAGDG